MCAAHKTPRVGRSPDNPPSHSTGFALVTFLPIVPTRITSHPSPVAPDTQQRFNAMDPSRADEAEEEEQRTQAAEKIHDNAPADATQTDTMPVTAPPPCKPKHRHPRQILPVLEHAVVDLAECDEASPGPSKPVAANTLTASLQHRLVEDVDAFVTFHSQISVDGANAHRPRRQGMSIHTGRELSSV
jgi:hypothetical protein